MRPLLATMAKVLVVGSSVVDLTFYAPKIPVVGETLKGRFVQGLGGKGFNQAVAARLAGAETTFISALGGDAFGPAFRGRLQELGISSALAEFKSDATGAAAISVDEQGRNSIIVALGANERLSPAFLDQNAKSFEDVAVLLMQFETNLEVVEHAMKRVRERSPEAIIVLNPAPAITPLPKSLLEKVDYFTPNETELEAIAGVKIRPNHFEEDLWKACSSVPVKAVLATLGEKGVAFFKAGLREKMAAYAVKAVDTAGAGDAFNGGFAAGLLRTGGDWKKAAQFGQAVAAISVTRPGTSASMPTQAEIERMLS